MIALSRDILMSVRYQIPLLSLLALTSASNLQAAGGTEPSGGAWKFGARTETFLLLLEPGIPFPIRVSESCHRGPRQKSSPNCRAVTATLQAATPAFRAAHAKEIPSTTGGAEPGSRICRGVFKATVALAEDSRGNRNAFCTFRDHSRVSTGSLASAWDCCSKPIGP
jgi:hypothetical protein